MNIREFNDQLFLLKKAHFLAYVKVAAETIGAPIPEVNFEGCTSFEDEFAHIHIEQNKICVSEQYVNRATYEDLRETATHEVAHLIDETHDSSFVKAHINVKTGSWIREHTSNEINQSLNSDDDIKPIQSQKRDMNFAGVMTNRTLKKLHALYESGEIGQDGFLDKIKDELVVVNRIIPRVHTMYESGEIGRINFLDKLDAFEEEKRELEAILHQHKTTVETASEQSKPNEEIEQSEFVDNTGKCDICGKVAPFPFECNRCLGIFCDEHQLPENHSCIPIKIIEDFKQFEEKTSHKSKEELIKDKKELEAILNPPKSIEVPPSELLKPIEVKTPILTKLFGNQPSVQKKTSRKILNAVLTIMGYLTIIGLILILYITINGGDVVYELSLSTYSDKIFEIWNEYMIPSSTSNIFDKIGANEKISKPQDKDLKSFDEINKFREVNSKFKILWSENVYNLAKFRANDMVKRGYFSHITPDGKDTSDYIGYYNFYADSRWGENLCMDCSNPTDVWIDSPVHREILLSGWGKGAVACEKNICVFIGVNE